MACSGETLLVTQYSRGAGSRDETTGRWLPKSPSMASSPYSKTSLRCELGAVRNSASGKYEVESNALGSPRAHLQKGCSPPLRAQISDPRQALGLFTIHNPCTDGALSSWSVPTLPLWTSCRFERSCEQVTAELVPATSLLAPGRRNLQLNNPSGRSEWSVHTTHQASPSRESTKTHSTIEAGRIHAVRQACALF